MVTFGCWLLVCWCLSVVVWLIGCLIGCCKAVNWLLIGNWLVSDGLMVAWWLVVAWLLVGCWIFFGCSFLVVG